MQVVYDHLALPDAAYLGKRIYKKHFFENAPMSPADRKAFTDDVEIVTWQYTLKPNTLPINPYEDDERDYPELAVIEVALRSPNRVTRIAELIHRAIPYPLFLVIVHNEQFAISVAHKRANRAERDAVVAEDILATRWMDNTALEAIEQAFLDSLAVSLQPQTHYYALYTGWHQRVLALACARLSGTFRVPGRAEQETQQRERLVACHQIEGEIERLRSEIRKESRFNRQVELNTRIKQLEEQLRRTAAEL